MKEPREKMPRRAETRESVVPFHPSKASSSELQQVSAGERLYMSMTEEGPTGEFQMTMQRDRHGRWMPTKMNIQNAREERRSFYVGESEEHGTFSIALAEASSLNMDNFIYVHGTPARCLGTTFLPKSKHSFRKQSKPNGKEYSISRR